MTDTPWLTLAEAAAYTKHSKELVRDAAVVYRRTNGAKGLRGGQNAPNATWRFKVEDLDRWVLGERPTRSKLRSVS